jgi:hypothetical protein
MKRAKRYAAFAVLVPSVALATSSGSFTAAVNNTACTINGTSGTVSAPVANTVYLTPAAGLQVQVPASTDVVITPSLVTGLYTDNKLNSTNANSLQNVGLFVQVTVEPTTSLSAPIRLSPNTTATGGTGQPSLCTLPADAPPGSVTSCAIYDQRFMQVQSSVLSGLDSCVALGPSGTCFELTEATLSAHAFNWYASLPTSGAYNVIVSASLSNTGSTLSSGSAAACAGPGTVTVTQVKNFGQNTPAQF